MNGSQSSEFKATLISQVIGVLLVSLGLIDTGQVDELAQHIMLIIGGLSTVVTSSLYIYSRFKLKSKSLDIELKKVVG